MLYFVLHLPDDQTVSRLLSAADIDTLLQAVGDLGPARTLIEETISRVELLRRSDPVN